VHNIYFFGYGRMGSGGGGDYFCSVCIST
jgi:hypothetical protein